MDRGTEYWAKALAPLGPVDDTAAVAQRLGLDVAAVEAARARGELLGVRFDGATLYPAAQFRDAAAQRAVRRVLAVLGGAGYAPETVATWLAGSAYEGETVTRLEVLLDDEATALAWAHEDAARLLGDGK